MCAGWSILPSHPLIDLFGFNYKAIRLICEPNIEPQIYDRPITKNSLNDLWVSLYARHIVSLLVPNTKWMMGGPVTVYLLLSGIYPTATQPFIICTFIAISACVCAIEKNKKINKKGFLCALPKSITILLHTIICFYVSVV